MQACEAHESRTLFGTIGISLSAVYRVHAHSLALLVLSLYFDTEPCALFSGAMLQPSQFRSLAKLLRPRGPDRVDFTFIRIDHSTIDSFVMISICRISQPDHAHPGLFRGSPGRSSIQMRCHGPVKNVARGSLAINSPAFLFPVLLEKEFTPEQPSWQRCHAASSRARASRGAGIGGWRRHGRWRLHGGRGGIRTWRWRRQCS